MDQNLSKNLHIQLPNLNNRKHATAPTNMNRKKWSGNAEQIDHKHKKF